MNIVIIGLSITSSWGNGHATTYRGLVRELTRQGHDVLFLERDMEWYASNRDLPKPPFGRTELYDSVDELKQRFVAQVRDADAVVVGSYVHEGIAIGEWVTKTARGAKAFYDIDTPVTLSMLARGSIDYLSRALIPQYDVYLSFTGGPTLRRIEREFGSPLARALYCSFDPELYFPAPRARSWDLGYMGTYSDDRQPALTALMLEGARQWTAGKFVVAGPMYPETIRWPMNVERIVHLSPCEHRAFYNAQKFTLNITRADMRAAGYSPSVRVFEAAACGTPIISDEWQGIGELFEIGSEILISRSAADTLGFLRELPEEKRRTIGEKARARVLREHTAAHRAEELQRHLHEAMQRRAPRSRASRALVNGSLAARNGKSTSVSRSPSQTPGSSHEAFGGTTPRPHSPSPLREEAAAPASVSPASSSGERTARKANGVLRPAYSPEHYVYPRTV
jgi:spore maturation protein CgeB